MSPPIFVSFSFSGFCSGFGSVKSVRLYLLSRNRIPRPLHLKQLHHLSVGPGGLETPLERLEKLGPLLPYAHKLGLRGAFCPLDPERDVDRALHGAQLAADPGYFARKVDFVAQDLAGVGVRAQRVEDAVHRRARRFLVVEDGEAGEANQRHEDGERFDPD